MDLSEIEKFETPIRISKLSDAIRIGSRNTKQSLTGKHFIEDDGSTCCALGAAALALACKCGNTGVNAVLDKHFGYHTVRKMSLIYLDAYGSSLHSDVTDGVPREIIADRFAAIGH